MPRLRGEDEHRIDYRHVIGWLVRKPGAFARYRYREDSVSLGDLPPGLRRLAGGRTASAPTSSTSASCTWRRPPASSRVRRRRHGAARPARRLRLRGRASARGAAACPRFRSSTSRRRTCASMTRSARERPHEPPHQDASRSAIRLRRCSRGSSSRRSPRELVSRFVEAEQQPALAAAPRGVGARSARSGASAASRACGARRSCRRARRSTPSTKAGCRRRSCASCTSSPRATSSPTRPMCSPSACPASGKSHAMCAIGHALVDRGHAVLFMPTYSLVQELLAAKRESRVAARLAQARSLRGLAPRRCGLHPAESRGGRGPLHAPRRTLRAPLGRHHEQSRLRAVGSDLSGSDGDGRGDRSPRAPLRAARVRRPELPDRAGEAPGESPPSRPESGS